MEEVEEQEKKEKKREVSPLAALCPYAPLCCTEHFTEIRNSRFEKRHVLVRGHGLKFQTHVFLSLLLLFLILHETGRMRRKRTQLT
jgi:hypothetical protein